MIEMMIRLFHLLFFVSIFGLLDSPTAIAQDKPLSTGPVTYEDLKFRHQQLPAWKKSYENALKDCAKLYGEVKTLFRKDKTSIELKAKVENLQTCFDDMVKYRTKIGRTALDISDVYLSAICPTCRSQEGWNDAQIQECSYWYSQINTIWSEMQKWQTNKPTEDNINYLLGKIKGINAQTLVYFYTPGFFIWVMGQT